MHRAAASGNLEAVQRHLARHPGDLDRLDASGNTPLHLAAYRGHEDVVAWLLAQGATTQATNPQRYGPLMVAAREGWAGVVKQLLAYEADPSGETVDGDTALMFCVLYARNTSSRPHEVFDLLVAAGADVNHRDHGGSSVLMSAACGGNQRMVELLIQHGADVTATNHRRQSAADFADERGFPSIALLLRSLAASPK